MSAMTQVIAAAAPEMIHLSASAQSKSSESSKQSRQQNRW